MTPRETNIAAAEAALVDLLRRAAPALLFGLRLWASTCLALYVAFWLELENPSWAATAAAIVCQPQLGASLRKASYLLFGTLIGAGAILVITACFPQDRVGFLVSVALWCAACGFAATILRNFASYGAALAGFTALIVAGSELGANGAPDAHVFMIAVARAVEIGVGIVSASVVLAIADAGGARRELAAEFAALSGTIAAWIDRTFAGAAPERQARPVRRELFGRVIALDPLIDTAIGEASDIAYRSPVLQAAVAGLFAALSGWRVAALHLDCLPPGESEREAAVVAAKLPPAFAEDTADQTLWLGDPSRLRQACQAAARALAGLKAETPSRQLIADCAAQAMLGLAAALNGLTLLADPERATPVLRGSTRLRVPDWLPATINALRIFISFTVVALFWIFTAWPSGPLALNFTAIIVILLAPQADQAYPNAIKYFLAASLAAVLACIVKLAVLPEVATFAGLCLVIGVVIIPLASFIAVPWQPFFFRIAVVLFNPLLAPANVMSFDAAQFFNSALAILIGIGAGALAMRLVPPLSPAAQSRRLLDLTLADLRRLARRPASSTRGAWENRVYGRLLALPPQAEPLQRAEIAAALSAGGQIIRLGLVAPRFGIVQELAAALEALAGAQSANAAAQLAALDGSLAAAAAKSHILLRTRASLLALRETLTAFAAYFDSGADI